MRWLSLSLGILVSTLAACGGDDTSRMPLPGARLVIVGPATFSLPYASSADLHVRYEQADGTPIAGATLDFAFDGFAPDATLAAQQIDTDESGEAEMALHVGSVESSFRVVATPPIGDEVAFQIAVTATPSGSISVEMTWGGPGAPAFTDYRAFLFRDVACADLDPTGLPTALIAAAPVTHITDRPAFVPVEVGTGYAVAVQASGGSGAYGCTDGQRVTMGQETRVAVRIDESAVPLRIDGVYMLDNRLSFAGLLPPSIASAVGILDELTDDNDVNGNAATMDFGQDPGAFLIDFAMRQTCHWECVGGEDYDTCSELNHDTGDISAIYIQNFRTWAGAKPTGLGLCGAWEDAYIPAQNLINGEIAMTVPDAITMWSVVAGDLARAIDRAHFTSRLTVDPATGGMATFIHEILEMTVTVHDLSGVEHETSFDVVAAGLAGRPRGEATLTVTGSRLDIAAHSFDLDYGLLVKYVYLNAVLPALGYASSAEMFGAWIDCDAVGATLASTVGGFDATEYAGYCDAALLAAGTYLDIALDGFIGGGGVLTLEGTAVAADLSADGHVLQINSGMWTGGWGEGATSGSVTGTFTGRP